MYTKRTVDVEMELGGSVGAMAYVITAERPHYALPSQQYYDTVRQGYRDAGFDPTVLSDAIQILRR